MFGKFPVLSGDAVIEAGADGEEDIAAADRRVGGKASVNPDTARIQRMRGWDGALSHDRSHDRNAGTFGKPRHGFFRAGDIDAAAHQEEGPLCLI